jgi:hypothetical protein
MSYTASESRSYGWAWIPALAFVLLCCPLISCCCLALGGAALFLGPPQSNVGIPETPPLPAVPAIAPGVDPNAEPLNGPVRLQRGFSPDPHTVELTASGNLDTSRVGQDCGFTTSPPTFAFTLSGGASETFLRLFFTAADGAETSLLVHTPDGEWLCETGSLTGPDPVVDLPFAPSGEYALWVGLPQSGDSLDGTLSITGSQDVTP